MEEFDSPLHGKGLRATQAFDQHAIVAEDRVAIGVLVQECLDTHCSYCFRPPQKHPLRKCANCRVLWYCSERCQRKDWDLHQSECILFNLLPHIPLPLMRLHARALIKMNKDESKLESFGVSNEERMSADLLDHFRQWGRMLSSLIPFAIPSLSLEEHVTLACALKSNSFTPSNESNHSFALLHFPQAKLFNHSCEPNAEYSCNDRNMRIISLKPIAKGEELTVTYVDRLLPYETRHSQLKQSFFFDCCCGACQAALPPPLPQALLPACLPEFPVGLGLRLLSEWSGELDQKLRLFILRNLADEMDPNDPTQKKLFLRCLLDRQGRPHIPLPDLRLRFDLLRIAAPLLPDPRILQELQNRATLLFKNICK